MYSIEKEIISEVSLFCEAHKVSPRRFCLESTGDEKLFRKLNKGKGLYSGTINKIRNYIKKHSKKSPN